MSIVITFAENVKKQRLSKNISQEKLAELCDLHRTYISDVERGTRNISIANVEKIANGDKIKVAEEEKNKTITE